MTNNDIRLKAAGAGVKLWEVAEQLGITEFTFSRWLRHEMPEEKKSQILTIIEEVEKERRKHDRK